MSFEYPNLLGGGTDGDSSIYLGDGTLSGDRTVTGGGHTLDFTGSDKHQISPTVWAYTFVTADNGGFSSIFAGDEGFNPNNGIIQLSASNGGSFNKQANIRCDSDDSDAQMRLWTDGASGNTNRVEIRLEPTTGITLHENTSATPGRIRLGLNAASQPPIDNSADTVLGLASSTRLMKRIEKDKFLGFDSDLTDQFRVFWENGVSKILFQDYSPNTVTLDIDSGFFFMEAVEGANSSSFTIQPQEIRLIFDNTGELTINNDAGDSNQVLTSQGDNLPPVWADVSGANIPAFASDAAAGIGGLSAGDLWKTSGHLTLPDHIVLVKT
jgi:hypothetical protein